MNKKGEEKKIAIEINYKHLETLASRMKRNAMENEKREKKRKRPVFRSKCRVFFFDLIGHSTALPLNSSNRGKCVPF